MAALLSVQQVSRLIQQRHHRGIALLDAGRFFFTFFLPCEMTHFIVCCQTQGSQGFAQDLCCCIKASCVVQGQGNISF